MFECQPRNFVSIDCVHVGLQVAHDIQAQATKYISLGYSTLMTLGMARPISISPLCCCYLLNSHVYRDDE